MQLLSKKEHPFRICQLTDLHLDPYPFSVADQETISKIQRLLASTKFDLIMITGDLIWGKRSADPKETMQYFYAIFDQINTPVAVTYGNHDTEGLFDRETIRSYESFINHPADKHQRFIVHDLENYSLQIVDHDSGRLSHVIYVWDSGAYSNDDRFGLYEPISREQINWFEKLPYDNSVPRVDLGFIHIPIPEYAEAKNFIFDGQIAEPIGSPEINSGLFYSLLKDANFKAIFAGHDHDNNFMANYRGIDFVYGNVSGFNTYGKIKRGYKQIDLYEDHITSKNIPFPAN